MSVESFLSSQGKRQPTFKDVAGKLLPEKEKQNTRPWKWEDEIENEGWERMEKELMGFTNIYELATYLELAFSMHLLEPNRPIGVNSTMLRGVNKAIENLSNHRDFEIIGQCIDRMRLLYPKYTIRTDEGENKIWEIVRLRFNGRSPYGDWIDLVNIATIMRIHKYNDTLSLNKKETTKVLESLRTDGKWRHYIALATNLRLIDPNYTIHISNETWDELEHFLQTNKSLYASTVLKMRILAAHKIEVTKEGIQITDDPPETLDVSIPPRPIRKKTK